jgi:hypothetical protein
MAVARLFRPESFAAGLILLGLGVVWMLANMGRLDLLETLRIYWPLALVAWGAAELVAWFSRRGAAAGRRMPPGADPVLPSQLAESAERGDSSLAD